MPNIDWSAIVTVIVFILTTVASTVYFVTSLEANTKSNKEFFVGALGHLRELVKLNDESSKQSITREISHLKEAMESNQAELKEDIRRLERKQEESNKIKERLTIQEQSEKSLHKRLDRLDKIFDTNSRID